jgi:DNA-binding HxlR family transcriptional regulator
MSKRSYRQYCALARALDLVGERWTLLVVRELVSGPKRYKDLLDGLPGIGTNLLASRLRNLESAGVVRRSELAPPAGSSVYELTERGRALEPAVMALGRWGAALMGPPHADDRVRPGWFAPALQAAFRPEAAREVDETYEFQLENEVFHVRVAGGAAEARQGPAVDPDLVVSCGLQTFLEVWTGLVPVDDALAENRLRIEGGRAALRRCLRLFRLSTPEPAAAA